MDGILYWRNDIRAGILDADEHQWLSDRDNKCRGIVSMPSVYRFTGFCINRDAVSGYLRNFLQTLITYNVSKII